MFLKVDNVDAEQMCSRSFIFASMPVIDSN